jgi:hypothetical protein
MIPWTLHTARSYPILSDDEVIQVAGKDKEGSCWTLRSRWLYGLCSSFAQLRQRIISSYGTRLKGDRRDRGGKGLQCATLYDELQTSLVGFKKALLLSRNPDDRQIKNPLVGQWSTHHVMNHQKSLCKEPP